MLSALLTLSALFGLSGAEAGEVRAVHGNDRAVTIRFDDVVESASAFSLAGPDRIAIDVTGATIDARAGATGRKGRIRLGQFDANTARIVIDLDRPAVVQDGGFSSDGRSLTLKLQPVGSGEFLERLRRGRQTFLPPAEFRAKPPERSYTVSVPLGKPADEVELPPIKGSADDSRPLVVIDAGHGGHDPGAVSPHGGVREKDVTLAIAREIRDRLLEMGRIRVALTRDSDRFLVLQERYGIARRLDADLFISIHADAAGNPGASGATIYTLSEVASDREAARLAARENKADIINGVNLGGASSDVSSILIDLTQRETMNISSDFAKMLLREAESDLRLRSNSHRFASFVVLKAPDTPSILFETGYLTNEKDVDFLTSRRGRSQIADAVARAVKIHFARLTRGN